MQKQINHAIIGCGRIAQNHYDAAVRNGMKVVACCDLSIDLAKSFAEKNNIDYYTDNYHEFIERDDIDSVSVCTDHKSHVEIAQDFLNKKHIVIEKPLSSNLEFATKFYKASKNSKKKITVIAQHRFDDVVNLIKIMLDEQAFGDITLVTANLICDRSFDYYDKSYWRGKKQLEGGSTIINQSFHMVDTLNYLFGLPKKVATYQKNIKFKNINDTEDTSVSIVDYEKFLCTIVSTNTSIQEWKTAIQIVGTKGDVTFNIDFPEEIIELNVDEKYLEKYNEELIKIRQNYKHNLKNPANYYGLSHIQQFSNFKNSIENGEKIKIGIAESLSTQKYINEIYKG